MASAADKAGDKFLIATDPSTPPIIGGYKAGSPNGYFTAKELDYLLKQGIVPIPAH